MRNQVIAKITELTHPPIVGEYYLVPCVLVPCVIANSEPYHELVPIILNAHSDADLGVSVLHYHRDMRFIDCLDSDIKSQMLVVIPLICRDGLSEKKIHWSVLKCLRKMPELLNLTMQKEFEKKYLRKPIKCGKCPHKGFDLLTLPQNKHKVVICNGHGLACDMKRKKVIKRFRHDY